MSNADTTPHTRDYETLRIGTCGSPRASPHRPRVAGARTLLEVAADERLERAEVAVGQVLEPTTAGGHRGVGRLEGGDRAQQVLVVLGQLRLHHAGQYGVTGQRLGRAGPVTGRIDERLEAHPLQPLRDRAAIPPEGPGGRLHVEAMLAQAGEHRRVAVRLDVRWRPGRRLEAEVVRRED